MVPQEEDLIGSASAEGFVVMIVKEGDSEVASSQSLYHLDAEAAQEGSSPNLKQADAVEWEAEL